VQERRWCRNFAPNQDLARNAIVDDFAAEELQWTDEGDARSVESCDAGALATCLAMPISIAMASVASAHVKWFVTCEPSDIPIPLQLVLTERFWLFSTLFILLFYFACKAEQMAVGALLTDLLDRATSFLRDRADVLLRAVAAVSFSLLWADGTVVLAPELKGTAFGCQRSRR